MSKLDDLSEHINILDYKAASKLTFKLKLITIKSTRN